MPWSAGPPPIAVEGVNCWKRAAARRVAFLVDGQSYYTAVKAALERASRQVIIIGWDFHRRVKLTPDARGAESELELAQFLERLVRRSRRLNVLVLDWDYIMPYVVEREALPSLQPEWQRDPRLRRRLDAEHPPGASHHMKLVVIDDRLAFCGGLDLTIRRWDTRDHTPDDPRRVDPEGKPYGAFHDVQMAVDGPAARALADQARERWRLATGEALERPDVPRGMLDPWPDSMRVDLRDARVAIARTFGAWRGRPEVREVERLFQDAIRRAKRSIYIEAHMFTSDGIVDALVKRLGEPEGPEVLAVVSPLQPGFVDAAMCGLRDRLLRKLRAADRHHRFAAVYPVTTDDQGREVSIQIHSKVMIIDGQHLHLGSANLSNRSMGFDTECDLALDAEGHERIERAICGLRDDLLAEHLGTDRAAVARTIRQRGSLLAVLERLNEGPRRLVPADDVVEPWLEEMVPPPELIDPSGPYEADKLVDHLAPKAPRAARRPVLRAVLILGLFLAIGLAWQLTPLHRFVELDRVLAWAEPLRTAAWGWFAATLLYAAASLLLVPVTVMAIAMAVLFGPVQGWLGSLLACVLSGLCGFGLGRRLLRSSARGLLRGPRLERLERTLGDHGFAAVATVRLVPIAPFTVVNMVAGASRVKLRDFVLGTVVSMAPGLLAMSLVADRVAVAVSSPSSWSIAVAVALIVVLVLIGRWGKSKLTPHEPAADGGAGPEPAPLRGTLAGTRK